MTRREQFVRYIVVGATSYLIEMGSLYILHNLFGLTSLVSVAISFWIGFSAAFVLQKWFAFASHDKTRRTLTKQLLAYSTLATWNYVFTLGMVALFTPLASVFILRTIAIIIITIWNFAIYRVIFKTSTVRPSDS